ncbi:MAG: hypothetical protein GC164_10840 [Phycisphaera sp.]|nr:hypothetical protein [Phycisphaera sp.]
MLHEAAGRGIGLILLVGFVLLGVGCAKQLFPEDLPRSQYERYSQLRGDYRPMSERNAYGIEKPALRDRLRPLERTN